MNHLNEMVAGYLVCAEWADKPEESRARFTKSAIDTARKECAAILASPFILYFWSMKP